MYFRKKTLFQSYLFFLHTPVVFCTKNLDSLVAYGSVSEHAPAAAAASGHTAINPPEARVFRLLLALEAAPEVAKSGAAALPAAEELCTANAV
jgi:hypothetical protein